MENSIKLILILMLTVATQISHASSENDKYVTGTASGILESGDPTPYDAFINDLKAKADSDAANQCFDLYGILYSEAMRTTPYGLERDWIPYSDYERYTVSASYRCLRIHW